MSYNFGDHFWELDFTGVQGYDVLVKRLKDGKKMTQDFEDFVRARAKLEEGYAKDLLKLVKGAHGETEIGSLRASWDSLKAETEASSREHLAVAQRLTNELEKNVKEFKERQRDIRKKAEDTVKKAQGFKKNAFQSENKAKQEYHSKCRAADKAEEVSSKSGHLQPKKIEELRTRAKKARLTAEQSDMLYQESIENLDKARVLWEREMEVCCSVFQDLEEERILFLRSMMWKLTNVYSSLAVKDDEFNEAVRCSLEQCDADSDLMLFVQQKRTGSERPVPIEYENFYGNNPVQSSRPTGVQRPVHGTVPSTSVTQPPATMHSRSLPVPPGSDVQVNHPNRRPSAEVPQEMLLDFGDGAYSVVPQSLQQMQVPVAHHNGNVSAQRNGGIGQCRANFAYEAQGPEELSFNEGEVLIILMKEDTSWWMGELRGRQGMFPCSFVSEF